MCAPLSDRPLSSLLEHQDFVRLLARQLLRDEHGAQDLEQSTWVAALEARAGEPRSVRGYLAGILRNMAGKHRRSAVRRASREREASRPEHLPSTAEIVAREEWRRRIVERVLELDPREREVVLLRYFEGLPPRRIARLLGVPVETVKTRLKRGLANLRPKLESEHGRPQALGGLALVAFGSSSATKLVPWTDWGVRVMSESARWKLVGLGAVLVVAMVMTFPLTRSGARVAEEGSRLEPVAREAPSSSEPIVETHEDSLRESVQASETTLSVAGPALHGRILATGTGSPVAGAEIGFAFRDRETSREIADSQGAYALVLDEPAILVGIDVGAGRTTVSRHVSVELGLAPGEPRELDLSVGSGATLSGRVVDDEGNAISRAAVAAWCATTSAREPDRRTIADERGRFTLEHVGEEAYVEASAAGLVAITAIRGSPSEGARIEDLVLELARPAAHRIRVVSAPGNPIEGAIVELRMADLPFAAALTRGEEVFVVRPAQPSLSQATLADGTCTFERIPAAAHRIDVRHGDHAPWQGLARLDLGAEETIVVLPDGESIAGRVLAPDGSPVAGAEVCLRTEALFGRTETDEHGRFILAHLALAQHHEPAWLSVVAAGYAVFVHEPVIPGAAGQHDLLLRLEESRAIAGVVRNGVGETMEGVRVEIDGDRQVTVNCLRDPWKLPTWESLLAKCEVSTGADGRFRFEGLYDGQFRVALVWNDGVERRQFFHTRSGAEALELVLDPDAADDVTFEGRVTDATNGEPVPRSSILVLGLDPQGATYNSPRFEIEAPDGSYRIGGLAPMRLSLFVSAPGYRDAGSVPEERAPGRHREDVQLSPVRHLSIRVVDQRGRPLPALVTVTGADGKWIWIPVGEGRTGDSIQVGEDGVAILQNLPAESVRIGVAPKAAQFGPEDARKWWEFSFDLTRPIEEIQELAIDLPE